MEKAKALDKVAARLIFDGFIAYGWTYSELNNTRAKLLDQLRLYIDLPQLLQQEEEEGALAEHNITSPAPSISTNSFIDDGVANSEWGLWDNDNINLSEDQPRTPFPEEYDMSLNNFMRSRDGGDDLFHSHPTSQQFLEQLAFPPGPYLGEWHHHQAEGIRLYSQNRG